MQRRVLRPEGLRVHAKEMAQLVRRVDNAELVNPGADHRVVAVRWWVGLDDKAAVALWCSLVG